MKGTGYKDILQIETVMSSVLNDMPKQELEKSFIILITRSERRIIVKIYIE